MRAQLNIQHGTSSCWLVSYCTLGSVFGAFAPVNRKRSREAPQPSRLLPRSAFVRDPHEKRQFCNVKSSLRPMLSVEQLKAISGCNVTRTSKGLRPTAAPCTIISLPTELLVHALEYASLDEAFAAFDVSKAFRSASRFALNKGRWAPVVKVVLAIKSFPWRQYGFAKQKHVDQVQAEFAPRGTRGSRASSSKS